MFSPALTPVDNRINDYLGDRYFEGVTVPANNGNTIMTILTIVWTIGILLLVAYTVISYWRLHREIDTAVRYKDNIFQSENVSSPFVLRAYQTENLFCLFKLDDRIWNTLLPMNRRTSGVKIIGGSPLVFSC